MADDTGGRHNGIAARRPAGAQHSQESLDRSNRDRTSSNLSTTETDDEEDGEEEEGEDTEPSLKYSKLTASLSQLYRGKDSTSASLISGDKMIVGTHNGNIHILSIPSLQTLRQYHAHSASVTAISVSPFSPSMPYRGNAQSQEVQAANSPASVRTGERPGTTAFPRTAKPRSNTLYIATSSIDGHVCVSSIADHKDVILRNYARPLQAVALSPEFKNDRSYLSGGLAGNLILTTGGQQGVSANASTNSATAAASGWLGSIGLGQNTGKDTVLHSGEGSISTIRWSLSGRYVVWVNEHGIKIMRSNLHADTTESDSAWKRIAHIDRPSRRVWTDMAGVWKARAQWIDEDCLESVDHLPGKISKPFSNDVNSVRSGMSITKPLQDSTRKTPTRTEKLLVGWGDTVWMIQIARGERRKSAGQASIVHQFLFSDGVVSGLSLYTPNLLLALICRTRDDDDNPIDSPNTTPRRGIHKRQNGLPPELRLIDLDCEGKDELEADCLSVDRYESLSMADYHLSTLFLRAESTQEGKDRRTFGTLGDGLFDVSKNATRLFSSGNSVRSSSSGGDQVSSSPGQSSGTKAVPQGGTKAVSSQFSSPGFKVFVHTPFDCVFAMKRDLSDHLTWLIEQRKYKEAWHLVDTHPEVADAQSSKLGDSRPGTPSGVEPSLADFLADESSSRVSLADAMAVKSAEREKQRIGDLWMQQLVDSRGWAAAGNIAGKSIGTASRWDHWVRVFAENNELNHIAFNIPKQLSTHQKIPSSVYELVLSHYISHDLDKFNQLLQSWDPPPFDVARVISIVEDRLAEGEDASPSVPPESQAWRLLQSVLANLNLADDRPAESFRYRLRNHEANAAFDLVKEYNLFTTLGEDDIYPFILLRITPRHLESSGASLEELSALSSDAIRLLATAADQNLIPVSAVIDGLTPQRPQSTPFLFFYFRALWNNDTSSEKPSIPQDGDSPYQYRKPRPRFAPLPATNTTRFLLTPYSTLAIDLFAEYSRPLLTSLLKSSDTPTTRSEQTTPGIPYNFDHAAHVCRSRGYTPELVHLLAATGATRQALTVLLDAAPDVHEITDFVRDTGDHTLWTDLAAHAFDASDPKPDLITAILAEIGGASPEDDDDDALNPAALVARIPKTLPIPHLKPALLRLLRDADVQHSISSGAARVLRSEVADKMSALHDTRTRGVAVSITPDTPRSESRKCPLCSAPLRSAADQQQHIMVFPCPRVHTAHLACVLSHLSTQTQGNAAPALLKHIEGVGADGAGRARGLAGKMEKSQLLGRVLRGRGCVVCGVLEASRAEAGERASDAEATV